VFEAAEQGGRRRWCRVWLDHDVPLGRQARPSAMPCFFTIQRANAGVGWQGKYKDDGANDTLMAASYVGREWSNLAPFDANAPGGAS